MSDLLSQLVGDRSARWHAQFLDNLPVGVFRTTVEGRFVFCNKTLAKMLGFSSAKKLTEIPVIGVYFNIQDRGKFIQEIIKNGRADRYRLVLKTKNGRAVQVRVSARAVFDDEGLLVFLDGVVQEADDPAAHADGVSRMPQKPAPLEDYYVLLDFKGGAPGKNADIRPRGGPERNDWADKPLFEFIEPGYRDLFALYLTDLIEKRRKKGEITLREQNGLKRRIRYEASVTDEKRTRENKEPTHERENPAKAVSAARKTREERSSREKFEGVKEMAGGVSHKMNQPLTIINNMLSEILADFDNTDENYRKIAKVREQVRKINDIAKKIGNIKKYQAIEYVAGIKIVDIDKAT